MNIQLNRLALLALFAMTFFACEKDEDRAIVRPGAAAPALSATASTVALSKPTKGADALTISATPSNYGYQAAVTYTLQLARKGTNFAQPQEIALDKTLSKKFTVGEFNGLLGQLGLPLGIEGQVEARVRSTVSALIDPVYSNVVTISATPYLDVAARLASVNNNKVYEGYVYFENPTTNFTVTLAPNFTQTLGDAGNGTTKVLKEDGADMIVNGAGFYLIKADLDANTWSATPIKWGIIGNATADGWGSDQDMVYDPAAKVWKATLTLVSGEMKFRANDDWGINMGDSNPKNGSLDYNGDNIPVADAGQYEITLDLNTPGAYKYTSTKK